MSGTIVRKAAAEPRWLRLTLTAVGLGFLFLFLALPLVAVFSEAFAGGWNAYREALSHPEALSAIGLTKRKTRKKRKKKEKKKKQKKR